MYKWHKPFLHKLLLVMLFYHSNTSTNQMEICTRIAEYVYGTDLTMFFFFALGGGMEKLWNFRLKKPLSVES